LSSSAVADDRALVDRFLRSGDEAAFRALYRAHAPALYAFALRLTRGNDAEAQDVLQEMWLRATPKLGDFRWQSTLRTWLHSVALNVHRERLRKMSRQDAEAAETRRRFYVVGATAESDEVDLERGIHELPDGYREVLLLHDVEGYTHKEISVLLEIEEGTSKSQLSKARRAMRIWLDSQGVVRDAR
jgi:RNA polymerase sigma-70 factor (ECF subfamily)